MSTDIVSGILCESYDEQNYSLAYITNKDNFKYLSLKTCPLLCSKERKQGPGTELLKTYVIYCPLSSFPSALQEKTNLKVQLKKFSSLGGKKKKRETETEKKGRQRARWRRHTVTERSTDCVVSMHFANKINRITSSIFGNRRKGAFSENLLVEWGCPHSISGEEGIHMTHIYLLSQPSSTGF